MCDISLAVRRIFNMIRVILLLALVCGRAYSFEITDNGADVGFTVTVNKKAMLEHTPESPIFFIGKGDLQVTEDSGNFFFSDKLSSRIPLFTFSIAPDGADSVVTLTEGSLEAKIKFSSSRADTLEISVDSVPDGFTHFWLRVAAEGAEEIYGMGEQFSYVNLRERGRGVKNVYPVWINEQGVGRDKSTLTTFYADTMGNGAGGDYYTTYFAQPTFTSTRNYFFHHEGPNYAVFDFSAEEFHEIFVYQKPAKFVLRLSSSLVDTVQSLAKFLGHMPVLPDWIQEKAIVSVQGGTERMKQKFNIAEQYKIPVSGVWIQDWSGQKVTPFGTRVNWNWKWSSDLYPGLDEIIKEWGEKGVKVLGYINPNLDVQGDLFKEAASKGYLVKNSTGGVYLRRSITLIFGQVDFTNTGAYDWYKNVIKTNMIDLGLGGWMADFGEYLAVDAVLADGRTGMEVHNQWPALWAKLNREAVEESGKLGEVVFFTRSGFTGTSASSLLLWNGDQNVDFSLADGVRSALYASIGAGLNGMTHSHFDIGGYTTRAQMGLSRSTELLLRSAEFAAFTSVFRTHEGNEIKSNVQWYDEGVTEDFAVHANNFAKLADYRKHVGNESVEAGLPAMRLTSLVFPDNPDPVPFDQYMFGSDLLVAPVYTQGAQNRSVTLPQLPGNETWVNIWNGKEVEGYQTLTVDAPLGQLPVFYRSSSAFVSTFKKLLVPPVNPTVKPKPDSATVGG